MTENTGGNLYHYRECGLDNVYLANGFHCVDRPSGREVTIENIDALHEAIGKALIDNKKDLSGKEIRFLRQEMLMPQAFLAKLLDVAEQTVHRWEAGKTDIPKPAETLIRVLYREHVNDKSVSSLRKRLERLSDLENAIDGQKLILRKHIRRSNVEWSPTAHLRLSNLGTGMATCP
jgi:putative transcriptional regulator